MACDCGDAQTLMHESTMSSDIIILQRIQSKVLRGMMEASWHIVSSRTIRDGLGILSFREERKTYSVIEFKLKKIILVNFCWILYKASNEAPSLSQPSNIPDLMGRISK